MSEIICERKTLPLETRHAGESVDLILPAGGRIGGEFADEAGTEIKALIRLNDQTILRRTLGVFQATGRIGRVIVVGPDAVLKEADACGAVGVPEGETGPDNFFRGLDALHVRADRAPTRALLTGTDLPFLTPEAISAFLDACPPQADVAAPVVTQRAFESRFPDVPSVYTPLREGTVTLGCAFLVNPQTLLRNRPHIERIFAARKSQITMARLLGPRFIAKFLLRRLALADIEARCEQVLRCTGAAVPNAPAELAFDIDLPEDYAYARAHAAAREESRR
jgi:GTP:adenosylcobinamide-phosphate guanylyltransferase